MNQFICIALLAATFFAHPALSEDAPVAAKYAITSSATPEDQNLKENDAQPEEPEAAAAPPKKNNLRDVCEITGSIAKIEMVQRSPWTDGTPTTMTITEMHVWVSIADRTPRNPAASPQSPCHQEGKDEMRTYKVCSPTQVRPGDRIHGTEGTDTGSAMAIGCLFDIAVLPKT